LAYLKVGMSGISDILTRSFEKVIQEKVLQQTAISEGQRDETTASLPSIRIGGSPRPSAMRKMACFSRHFGPGPRI
jgi:hypothetical protein